MLAIAAAPASPRSLHFMPALASAYELFPNLSANPLAYALMIVLTLAVAVKIAFLARHFAPMLGGGRRKPR
ncbi:MAG: hypothetical protein BroJett013_26320 [Alphaproteobacteria bacterium]|nr:MAG: hypothetical protein BroJett013_26320 [Alphaproteobacteria bacterium]